MPDDISNASDSFLKKESICFTASNIYIPTPNPTTLLSNFDA